MATSAQHKPLTDAELARLGDFLMGCKGGRAMNVANSSTFVLLSIGIPGGFADRVAN